MSSENKIQEMQDFERSLQNLLLQKQSFQIESAENEETLNEIEKTGDEVFKMIGQLIIKTEKEKVKKELEEKKKILELRIKTFEKQEKILIEKLDFLREEVMKEVKKR